MRHTCLILTIGFASLVLGACTSSSSDSATEDSVEASTTTISQNTTTSSLAASADENEATTSTSSSSTPDAAEDLGDSACGLAVRVVFDEGAPRDRMTISNDSSKDVNLAAVEFDLTNSAGQVIFDTLDGGSGVEVFQDFQVESGDASLSETPVAEDGASNLRLNFSTFGPSQSFTFSIDVDDQLTDSDLGQIQVTGGELAGAEAIITTADGARSVAVFNEGNAAELPVTC